MDIPGNLVSRFEIAKSDLKLSISMELRQFETSIHRRIDNMFSTFIQDLKTGLTGLDPATNAHPLAPYFTNAIPVTPVIDSHNYSHSSTGGSSTSHPNTTTTITTVQPVRQIQQQSQSNQQPLSTFSGSGYYVVDAQTGALSKVKYSSSQHDEMEALHLAEVSIEQAMGGEVQHTHDGSNAQIDLDLNFENEDGDIGDATDQDAFCLNNLYWINMETLYQACLLNGRFSALNFDFGITTAEPEKRWQLHPMAAIKDLQERRGPDDKFPLLFGKFANDIFKRLGDVYPYEVPRQVIDQLVTIFCYQYRPLDAYFQIFKKRYPEDRFARCVSIIDLLSGKVKNKFKVRSNELKKEGLWIYRTPYEREKYQANSIGHAANNKKSKHRRKTEERDGGGTFDYVEWKPKMEEKMEQMVEVKQAQIQNRVAAGGTRKRKSRNDNNGQ